MVAYVNDEAPADGRYVSQIYPIGGASVPTAAVSANASLVARELPPVALFAESGDGEF